MERLQFQSEMRIKALHQKNLVKAKKIIIDSIKDHLVPQVYKDTKIDVWFLDQAIWREEHTSEDELKKPVEECEDPECWDHIVILYKGI